ncbi:arabinan endo-1,5-alpha-L-arabinosidase [Massilia sp. CF038]|uniref:arabinan endo-1,5-alpha-L-arabinosidase n=1 Tax=Massilia sp. CF038 TaxID=1881045 RepID=UPI000932AB44|nr:arabinan endo-1,5-alpha-L-arabinosidase [Massilia sp. CF038]
MTRAIAALGMLAASAAAMPAMPVSVHDPVMAKEGSDYYLFSTGPGITFYSSPDMRNWRAEGRVFSGEPGWAKKAAPSFDGHVWAPDIHAHDGRYFLFYSVSGFGKNTSGIGVTTNATLNPRAPHYLWQDQGMVLQSVPGRDNWNAIDPNIIDDEDGTPWMAFGSFWSGIKLVKLDRSHTRLAEPQVWHALAQRARAAGTPETQAGPAEIEGPHILKKDGYYYLFVSWGLCCRKQDSTYHVVVGRAQHVTGPYLDRAGKDMNQGGGSLVIAGNAAWRGVGHNSAYTIDGHDLMVLHAYETADNYLQKLKILEMHWDSDGWPVVDPGALDRYQSQLRK